MPQSFDPPAALVMPQSVDELLLLDDEAFVRAAYALVLGRHADESGLNSFLRQVRQGVSKERVIVTLANSDEARSRGGAAPMLAGLLTMHAPASGCRLCRLIRRLLADALEPLLQQLRALDNRLYRLEQSTLKHASQRPSTAADAEVAAPPPPPKRLIALDHASADQLFASIRSWVRNAPEAVSLRQRPDPVAVPNHEHQIR